jgi:hypothetical protein
MTAFLILAATEASGLLGLLIWLLIFALVVYVIYLILGMLPLPQPIKNIVLIIVGVLLLIYLLSRLGLFAL